MASENNLNTTVIVRSVGESTEKITIGLLINVFGKENVFLIKDFTPFSEAVKETFRMGLQQSKKWTLAVDADVLIFKDKMLDFINAANEHIEQKDKKAFCLEGLLLDKLSNIYREVGLHLYQTKFLKKALKFVDAGMYHIRPETFVKKRMSELGYGFYVCSLKIGIHDFFQYPKSIVKKAILHCKKHSNANEMRKLWTSNKQTDRDFFWANKGAEIFDSLKDKHINVDKKFMDELIKDCIIDEDREMIKKENVNEILLKHSDLTEEIILFHSVFQIGSKTIIKRIKRKIKKIYNWLRKRKNWLYWQKK